MNEALTRQEIIDKLLAEAGWNINDQTQVATEFDINVELPDSVSEPQPPYKGHQFSDYVLLGKNGKPLAVVEAKKTSKDAGLGREQAKQYCYNIKKEYDCDLPFCFYTNGHEIYYWDLGNYPLMKKLDENDLEALANAEFTGEPYQSKFDGTFYLTKEDKEKKQNGIDKKTLRWSEFKRMTSEEMLAHIQRYVFPFLKQLNGGTSPFTKHMANAVFIIQKPSLLKEAVSSIDEIFDEIEKDSQEKGQYFQDIQGDVYEMLLSEIASAGKTSGSKKVIGKNIFFNQDYYGSFGAFCKLIRPKPTIFPEYLKHFFKTPYYRSRIISQVQGANINNLRNRDVDELEISIPENLEDQKRIAKVLSDCEALIQKRKESIALLDELLKSTFLEMFGNRDGEEIEFEEIIDIKEGLVNPNDTPYNEMYHVGGVNIEANTGKLINLKKAHEERLISGKYLFEPNDILYSKIRPYLNKVTVVDFKGVCSADIYPLKPKDPAQCNVHFLRYELQSEMFLRHANNNSGRANIPKINRKALNAYKTILPNKDEQKKFSNTVIQVEEIKSRFIESLQDLENLYGSLSQRAFKGELDLREVGGGSEGEKRYNATVIDQDSHHETV